MMGDTATHEYLPEILSAMRQLGYNPKENEIILDAGVIFLLGDHPVSEPYDYSHIRVWYKRDVFGIWDTKRKTFVD